MQAKNHTPKVAIIVPFYNVQKYLAQCLDSIINQSYKHLEIILVDDGSSDESVAIAREYFLKDKRISLICKSNGGQGSARNIALEYIDNGLDTTLLLQENNHYVFKANLKANALSANHYAYTTQEVMYYTGGGAERRFSA
ncbi:glycosyltransferase family 2 protein [Helicobacter jaachi]|uniref:Glycosyltransferase family 2 protein n=1 Tax=Helicobacter jaachi TaxID=1677920 RepID=A0A4U8TCN3_9HELI|nr:glycosyltransferase family 2 protein [Helicobacter jaachi]TLD97721.1 glycosyltransferase family 2 protein [Helicobacter jaachi]